MNLTHVQPQVYKTGEDIFNTLEAAPNNTHTPSMNDERIDKLLAKKAKIDAQLKDARARSRTQKRKDDTRRKIITGALALQHAEMHPQSDFTKTMLDLIHKHVTTDKDRTLFDLEPLPSSGEAGRQWKAANKK